MKMKDIWDNDPAPLHKFGQQHLSQLIKWCSDRLKCNDLSRVKHYMDTKHSFDLCLFVLLKFTFYVS